MKKNDFILIIAVLCLAATLLGIQLMKNGSTGGSVEVTIDGELFGRYELSEEQTVSIKEGNRLEIKDGKVSMVWADCRDQICVDHRAISRKGESMICLPNKVVVAIVEGKEAELDAIVK